MADAQSTDIPNLKVLQHNFFCGNCDGITLRKTIDKPNPTQQDCDPKHLPPSELCPDCGDRCSFSSARLVNVS